MATTFSHPHIIKLDRNNYILWKSQVLPAIRDYDLGGYIDGTHPCPSKFVSTAETFTDSSPVSNVEVNPLFLAWKK